MKKLPYLLLVCIAILAGCEEDDNGNNNNNNNNNNNTTCTGASMTINFDGQTFTRDTFNNTYLPVPFDSSLTGYRLDLRTNIPGGTFVLSVSNWSVQNPPTDGVKEKRYSTLDFGGQGTECIDVNGTAACDEALVTYATDTLRTYLSIDDVHDGHITITDCNTNDLTVSGTFDALIIEFATEDTIPVSGTFTNLCYRVLQ